MSDVMVSHKVSRRIDAPVAPLDACTVYKVPVAAFDGMNVVTLTLHFTDATGPQQKVHNVVAHGLVHSAIGGAPIDLKQVDATITEPTPLVIQSLIEMKSVETSASWPPPRRASDAATPAQSTFR
jgi:hypothetical protein